MPGFTHLQVGAAGDLRPSSPGLCRDARAATAGASPTRAGGSTNARWARRRSPARPSRSTATRPRRRWASTGRRPIRSTPSPTAISRSNSWRRRRSPATHLSRFAEEIVIWTERALRLRAASRRLHHRQLDHAAEAQSRRRRAGARQGRAAHRHARRAARGDEGPAARLCQGHAGGQGAGVRGRRHARAVPRRHGRHGARHDAPTRRRCAASPTAATAPRPISPTGWCARWACRSARRITSPARWSSAPRR